MYTPATDKNFFKIEDYLPELELTEEEIASMGGIISHPGFQAYQKVWRHIVSLFAVKAMNTEQSDRDLVLARHNAARVAAQLYQGVTNRVNQEINDFIQSRPSERPVESAPNLDLGGNVYEIDGEEPLV